ncbi:Leucine--tRNA ligase [Candidatus Ichthyocystis hellenicum]|uniref:Leucine--tRNA ligase n=1 Tax=Candidatus Ichthyocystis hellenicum TaxID=1561003 RepID=A0A0S4M4U6_9BURK|nr:leucine--tRNA ligase [Candidatus Ichthyocystis hellenicum]CUT17160.1 Leucine--tRNA ligase [Candidatus Ichthyocystis hellenicum]
MVVMSEDLDLIYNPYEVEKKARDLFDKVSYVATESDDYPKYYCLSMLPYPSGRLHMGHFRNYTIGDVLSRYRRLRGFSVMQPMGWDAFGLPAENAAKDHHLSAKEWTYSNISAMRTQLISFGFSIDWSREFATCSPDYYRWEQWLFRRFWEKGLIYRADGVVNWDPVDQTVLANEQVIDGRGWRSGAVVERRNMPMYYFKISQYADELLEGLDDLMWPEQVKVMQRNWIGRSRGVDVDFWVDGYDRPITVFTSRVDTIFGVTYIALSIDHELTLQLLKTSDGIRSFVEAEGNFSGTSEYAHVIQEKRGINTGVFAIHPLTGEKVPVWVANYVLSGYGSGAVMGVPAHDERDFHFAQCYQLPCISVINAPVSLGSSWQKSFSQKGVLINSSDFDGLSSDEAADKISEVLVGLHKGAVRTRYRLRDWGISRQRYWGCPIPVVHCFDCGSVLLPDDDLPLLLPAQEDMAGHFSLFHAHDWQRVNCPKCGKLAKRETDTLDTFVESSWYFLRYCCADNTQQLFDQRVDYWLKNGGIDQYIGGIEHAVMHLLYARFFTKALRDLGLISCSEPFRRLLTQGMVTAEVYYQKDESDKKCWVNGDDVLSSIRGQTRVLTSKINGEPVFCDGVQKMSKSKNNGVDPQKVVDRYGVDTVRLFMIFAAPPDQNLAWDDRAIEGSLRYLKKLWSLCIRHAKAGFVLPCTSSVGLTGSLMELRLQVHQTLKKVANEYEERMQLNTVVSALMTVTNSVSNAIRDDADGDYRSVIQEALQAIIIMAHPIVPHITSVLWSALVPSSSIFEQQYPEVDESAFVCKQVSLVVQVNSKNRAVITVDENLSEESVKSLALSQDRVVAALEGKTVKRILVVPSRLVNIVAE